MELSLTKDQSQMPSAHHSSKAMEAATSAQHRYLIASATPSLTSSQNCFQEINLSQSEVRTNVCNDLQRYKPQGAAPPRPQISPGIFKDYPSLLPLASAHQSGQASPTDFPSQPHLNGGNATPAMKPCLKKESFLCIAEEAPMIAAY